MSTPIWIAAVAAFVVAVVALVALATGKATLRAGAPAGAAPEHPVLLPEHPRASDVGHVRLATSVPGYQRDQVDGVLLALQEALARAEERIAELEGAAGASGARSCGEDSADPR